MKKLSVNITNIRIKGDPIKVYEIVTNLDRRIELLSNNTSQMKSILYKYQNSNAGKQYENAISTVRNLSEELYEFAEYVNELQREICKYIEKVLKFEGRKNSNITIRKLNLQIVKLPSNTGIVEYNLSEMNMVLSSLRKYVQDTNSVLRQISNDTINIGRIWNDPQYRIFSSYINDLCIKTNKAAKELVQYCDYLNTSIRRLCS